MSEPLGWGRQPPEGVTLAWGARAIYKQGVGQTAIKMPERVLRGFRSPDSGGAAIIDLLWDRQDWRGPQGPARKALAEWINTTGLPAIREACSPPNGLGPDESRVVSFTDGTRTIEASPNGSYGHLYLVAYEVPTDATAEATEATA
jgi:hypothetical protein